MGSLLTKDFRTETAILLKRGFYIVICATSSPYKIGGLS